MEASARKRDLARLDLAGVIYGVILATALIAAFSEQPKVGGVATFFAVIGSAVIFWLAHGYAHILAAGVVDRSPITGWAIREALYRQLPLVLGALPPALVLLAEPLGILSEDHSDNLALLVGVALLTAFGLIAARRRNAGVVGTIVLTAISAGLGLIMIGLKAAVH
jgi:LPXTG-motif cell wall-anchored protein